MHSTVNWILACLVPNLDPGKHFSKSESRHALSHIWILAWNAPHPGSGVNPVPSAVLNPDNGIHRPKYSTDPTDHFSKSSRKLAVIPMMLHFRVVPYNAEKKQVEWANSTQEPENV